MAHHARGGAQISLEAPQPDLVRVVELTVPGEPVPAARARKGKQGHWYTPPKTEEYRERIRMAWLEAGRPYLGTGSLSMSAEFMFGRPDSHLRKDGGLRKGAPAYPPCDLDNALKNLDALTGLAFADDSQIVEFTWVGKCYSRSEPCTRIEIRSLTDLPVA